MLQLIRWETHAIPNIGVDPQAVVNAAIPDDFDVFIGVMWQRFGTPTARAESGTLEEFQRAKARHDQDPNSVRVMFYFKAKAIPLDAIDPEQIARVKSFKAELSATGLYWTFDEVDDFERLVRIHLQRVLQESRTTTVPTVVSPVPTAPDEYEELEPMDLLFEFHENFAVATERMAENNRLVSAMTARMAAHAEGFTRATASGDLRLARRTFAELASDLNEHGDGLRRNAEEYFVAFRTGSDWLIRFIEAAPKAGADIGEVASLAEQIGTAQITIRDYREKLRDTDAVILAWPRMTKDLNIAKRKFHAVLDDLIKGYERDDSLMEEIRMALFALKNSETVQLP